MISRGSARDAVQSRGNASSAGRSISYRARVYLRARPSDGSAEVSSHPAGRLAACSASQVRMSSVEGRTDPRVASVPHSAAHSTTRSEDRPLASQRRSRVHTGASTRTSSPSPAASPGGTTRPAAPETTRRSDSRTYRAPRKTKKSESWARITPRPSSAAAQAAARSTSASPSHRTSRTPAAAAEQASCSYMSIGFGSSSARTAAPSRHASCTGSSRRCRSETRCAIVSDLSRVAGPSSLLKIEEQRHKCAIERRIVTRLGAGAHLAQHKETQATAIDQHPRARAQLRQIDRVGGVFIAPAFEARDAH
eukprot:scaffold19053_cov99-Isochrysis_galbana.AAC.4